MSSKKTVLLADDDSSIRMVLSTALSREGWQVRATSSAATVAKWIRDGEGDLVITDVYMGDEVIFDLLPRMQHERPGLPVLVMSGQSNVLTAVQASQMGAYEYFPKPFDLDKVIESARRAMSDRDLLQRPSKLALGTETLDGLPMVGRSAAMQDVFRTLARVMASDLTVLIEGENGTGKSLVASILHQKGRRREKPLVTASIAGASPDALEDLLFGRVEGSEGALKSAAGGTLYVDEITDLSMDAQARLVRALQTNEEALADTRGPARDARIILSTSRPLAPLVRARRFREDLFYRIDVVTIRLPPLRSRPEDIADLARHFLARMAQEGLPARVLSTGAVQRLEAHHWPGNLRELQNVLRRVAALASAEVIGPDEIDRELRPAAPPPEISEQTEDLSFDAAIGRHIAQLFAQAGPDGPEPGLYDRLLEQVERPLLAHTLHVTRGNQVKAAAMLGMNRNTLRKKLQDLGVRGARPDL